MNTTLQILELLALLGGTSLIVGGLLYLGRRYGGKAKSRCSTYNIYPTTPSDQ